MHVVPVFSRFPEHGPLLVGLTAARIIGWGSIFYGPSVLPGQVEPELGLSTATIFGGITILLVISGLASPLLGARLDRHGTRRWMCAGAIFCAAGLALLALSQGPASYLAAWIVLGAGQAMTLGTVDNVTIAQISGPRTRRVLGLMMLATAFSSGIFWPLTAALCSAYGWRATWLIFAAMHLVIVLPIYFAIPANPRYRRAPAVAEPAPETANPEEHGRVSAERQRRVFSLMAAAFAASGLVSWGLPLHLIHMMQDAGIANAMAVGIVSLAAPATLLARSIEIVAGERLPVEYTAAVGLLLGPLACFALALAPGSAAIATLFVVVFSAAMGVISIARATLPLALFGRHGFGRMLGRLALPQNLAFAAAPLLFAVMIERLGPVTALLVAVGIQSVAFLAMLVLLREIRRP